MIPPGDVAHASPSDQLTPERPARYTRPVNTRNQRIQGLQWGAWAWLGWVAWSTVLRAWHSSLTPELSLLAAVWLAALALTWTRWSRVGVAVALVVQAVAGTVEAAGYGGEMHFAWALKFWLPMSLPLLPLLFMEPDRPRLTLALLAVGRWRDAVAQLTGFRWLVVAAGVVLLNRAGWTALEGLERAYGWVLLPALLFALAAIPRLHKPATA
jgi:hypothetical protein